MNKKRLIYQLLIFSLLIGLISGCVYFTSLFYNAEIRKKNINYSLKSEVFDLFKRLKISFQNGTQYDWYDLPSYYIYLKADRIDYLNGLHPHSQEYQKGYIRFEDNFFETDLRYRGDNQWHYLYPKKSWRVKLKKDELVSMTRKFNLVNPKTKDQMQNKLVNDMAKKMGLIAPKSELVRVYVNNQYSGIYEYLSQVDESFIREIGRLPSDIYVGETPHIGVLWEDMKWWEKQSVLDSEEPENIENFEQLLKIVNDDTQTLDQLSEILDVDKFLSYYALSQVFGVLRFDNHHNHRYYFDPSTGKFEPIVWDAIGQSTTHPFLNINFPPNPIYAKLFTSPQYVHEKNKKIWKLLSSDFDDLLVDIDETYKQIRSAVYDDIFTDYVDRLSAQVRPVTNDGFDKSIVQLKEFLKFRADVIRDQFNEPGFRMVLKKNSATNWQVRFTVFGSSGVETFFSKEEFNGVCLGTDLSNKNSLLCGKINQDILLLSGLKKQQRSLENNPYLDFDYVLDELSYDFYVSTIKEMTIDELLNGIKITNAVTLAEVKIKPEMYQVYETGFPEITYDENSVSTYSLINSYEGKQIEVVTLEGNVVLSKNLVISENQKLVIRPGSLIWLYPKVSIISCGQVEILGTQNRPIVITGARLNPWGCLVLQGEKSKGSRIENTVIKNGSGARYGLVDYTGMISIYNSEIEIHNSVFSDNQQYDDLLNAKHSQVIVDQVFFQNVYSDAIDFDYSDGEIKNSRFTTIGNDAIDLMGSDPLIEHNWITGASDKGISVGEASSPLIKNNEIVDNNIAIQIKDSSVPVIEENDIRNNKIGIDAYHKNWRYPEGGLGFVRGNRFTRNDIDYQQDSDSQVIIENNVYE